MGVGKHDWGIMRRRSRTIGGGTIPTGGGGFWGGQTIGAVIARLLGRRRSR